MIREEYLKFAVFQKPDRDLYKHVQANAKFKTLSDVVRTKVGINNFYNFGIAVESSIVMRDIILNSQFVSGWARSSQVLNSTDSKFAAYRFLTKTVDETESWIKMMEELESKGHSMDNMRSLITLDSITNYAFSIDILNLLYLTIVLDSIYNHLDSTYEDLKTEIEFFLRKFDCLLCGGYGIAYVNFKKSMLDDALRNFPAIDVEKLVKLEDITGEHVYSINATYSVIGQIWRHRMLVKKYGKETYSSLVCKAKSLTSKYDFNLIGMDKEIADKVIETTIDAKSIYGLCQGSIVPFEFSGTVGAIHKALSQRTCFINDSPQFKDAFDLFKMNHPDLKLLPPCKLNTTATNNCYVGYVNESRRRGEEKTQVVCPIYCKAKGYEEDLKTTLDASKTKWYVDNLDYWKNVL